MRKILLFLFAFLLFTIRIGFAQDKTKAIDSLKHALQIAKDDTGKINILNSLSFDSWQTNKFDSATKYANEALALSKKKDFKKGTCIAYNNLGAINLIQDNYPEALKNELASLKIADEIGNTRLMVGPYNNMGNIYFKQGNYSEALKNYNAALKIGEDLGLKQSISNNYNNIGIIYQRQKNYPEALKNYNAALKIKKEFGDKKGISNSLDNVATIYFDQAKYPESLTTHLEALKIREEIGDKSGIVYCYINLGGVSIKLNKLAEAKDYLEKALLLSREIGSKDLTKEGYRALSNLDSISGDYKNAYLNYIAYSDLKDSLLNEKSDNEVSQLRIQYETEKKDKELQLKTVSIDKQKITIRYLIGGFILLVIFTYIYFRLYNQRRRTIFTHKVLETEMKALRSQMNPHFTFNVLNSIQYYVGGNDLKSVELYLNKFSTLIRMILDQSRNAYISLEQEITMLKLYLELEQMLFEKKFDYQIRVDEQLNAAQILIPGMLIQPIVENAIKHGLERKRDGSLIIISFSQVNSTLVCTVTDNGIGREAAKKQKKDGSHKSVATDIIKERMDALCSIYNIPLSYNTIDLYNSEGKPEGTRVSLEIPIGIKNAELKKTIDLQWLLPGFNSW